VAKVRKEQPRGREQTQRKREEDDAEEELHNPNEAGFDESNPGWLSAIKKVVTDVVETALGARAARQSYTSEELERIVGPYVIDSSSRHQALSGRADCRQQRKSSLPARAEEHAEDVWYGKREHHRHLTPS